MLACCWSACCTGLAADGHVNLLRNPEFNASQPGLFDEWDASPAAAWTRGSIESFKGLPFTMHYAQFKGAKGQLSQAGIAVETNTWYALRAWYKASLPGDGRVRLYALPGGSVPGARRYNQAAKYHDDRCDPEDSALAPSGGITLGSVNDWVEIQAYAYSGGSTHLTLYAETAAAGEFCLGNPEVIECTDGEYFNPKLADGNFRNSLLGREPLMFFAKPSLGNPARTVKYAGMTQDSPHCFRIVRKTEDAAYVYGPQSILVRPGEALEVSFWVKTSWRQEPLEDPPILTVFALRQGRWWRCSQAAMVTREWEKVVFRATVPEQGDRHYIPGPQLLDVHLQLTGGREDANISDFQLRILPAGQSEDLTEPSWWQSPGTNLVMNGSFEAGRKGWCGWFNTWELDDAARSLGEISIAGAAAADGRCSLQIKVPEYPAGSPTVQVISASFKAPAKEIMAVVQAACFEVAPNQDYALSFWARTEAPAGATVSAGEQTFALSNQWTRYAAVFRPVKAPAGLFYPSFRFRGAGVHCLDGVMMQTGRAVSAFAPAESLDIGADFTRPYALYGPREKPAARIFISNAGPDQQAARMLCTIRDWRDRVVSSNVQAVSLAAGATRVERIPLFHQNLGVFAARIELFDAAGAKRHNWFEFNYGNLPATDTRLTAAESPVGITPFLIHFWPGYNVPGGSLDDFNGALQSIGCRWIGMYSIAHWRDAEVSPGAWHWPHDACVRSFKKHGFEMFTVLGAKMQSVPRWARSGEPVILGGRQHEYRGEKIFFPRLETWEAYVRQFVGHYRDWIGFYEVLGETGQATPDWFMRLNQAAAPVIREVAPSARIMGPCYPSHALPWGGDDDSWVGQVFKKGIYDCVDIVTAHFYPPSERAAKALEESISARGTLEQTLDQRIGYLREAYGDKPLWNTEYGLFHVGRQPWFFPWQTKAEIRGFREGYRYATERRHAERWVRWNVILLAAGVRRSVQHTFGHAGLNMQSYQAMLYPDYSPKAVIGACAQMCRRLAAPRPRRQLRLNRTRLLLFDCRGGPVMVLWDYGLDGEPAWFEAAGINADDMLVEDLMGNTVRPETPGDGKLRLPLSTAPVYVIPRSEKNAESIFMALHAGLSRAK